MKMPITAATAAMLALATPVPSFAHHAGVQYDETNLRVMSGTVTRFDFSPDQSWLFVTVVNEDGTTTVWLFEPALPPELPPHPLNATSWEAGDTIIAKVAPLRDGRSAGAMEAAVTNGTEAFGDTAGLK